MLLLKRIRDWLLRKKTLKKPNLDIPPGHLQDLPPDLPRGLQNDIGVTVTRIRLPSGNELVIVERAVAERVEEGE